MNIFLLITALSWFFVPGSPGDRIIDAEHVSTGIVGQSSVQSHPCPYVRSLHKQKTRADSASGLSCPYIRGVHKQNRTFNQVTHKSNTHTCPYLAGENAQAAKKKDPTFWI